MDLFEKIDQFEKMANDLADKIEEDMAEDAETVEESVEQKFARRETAKRRFQKLASYLKR